MERERLTALMERVLADETGQPAAAKFVSGILARLVFTFREEIQVPARINLIVVAAFGQYRDEHGNALPDLVVNPQLKQLARQFWEQYRCDGFAQWEVACAEGEPLPGAFRVINPAPNPVTGNPQYLSTRRLFNSLDISVEHRGEYNLLILAHRLHAYRCVSVARALGFRAFAPYEQLPTQLDPRSSQPWTRPGPAGEGELYILHEIISRLRTFQEDQLNMRSPSGL